MTDLSPAGQLRAAAKLVRERAEGATPGPWCPVEGIYQEEAFAAVLGAGGDAGDPETWIVATGRRAPGSISQQNDAAHIAGMHPGVARAVADLLELEAKIAESITRLRDLIPPEPGEGPGLAPLNEAINAVARAYLSSSTEEK